MARVVYELLRCKSRRDPQELRLLSADLYYRTYDHIKRIKILFLRASYLRLKPPMHWSSSSAIDQRQAKAVLRYTKLLAPSDFWPFDSSSSLFPRGVYRYCISPPLEMQHETNPPSTVALLALDRMTNQFLMLSGARWFSNARDGSKIRGKRFHVKP